MKKRKTPDLEKYLEGKKRRFVNYTQRAFSVYTDIRKLQDKAKTSYTLTVSERCQSSIPCQTNCVS